MDNQHGCKNQNRDFGKRQLNWTQTVLVAQFNVGGGSIPLTVLCQFGCLFIILCYLGWFGGLSILGVLSFIGVSIPEAPNKVWPFARLLVCWLVLGEGWCYFGSRSRFLRVWEGRGILHKINTSYQLNYTALLSTSFLLSKHKYILWFGTSAKYYGTVKLLISCDGFWKWGELPVLKLHQNVDSFKSLWNIPITLLIKNTTIFKG